VSASEVYDAGDSYSQRADEIHETDALDGTVTIIRRHRTGVDTARIFWPAGQEWGDALPRPATWDELTTTLKSARRP
jgi:hypothetical protein